MRNKHDMYIDYKRSYKKRGRRGNKWYFIAIAVVLAICLGGVAYYSVNSWLHTKDRISSAKELNSGKGGNAPAATIAPTPVATTAPVPSAKPTPTQVPLLTPTAGISAAVSPSAAITEAAIEAMNQVAPVKVKGIYVTSNVAGSDRFTSLVELAQKSEINAMVIDVKDDRGKISFQMDCEAADKIGAITNTITDIDAFVKELKDKKIYLIARIVAFKDPYLAEQRKDLAIKYKDGTLYRDNNGECWVNPYNKKVWRYLTDIAGQAAAAGFDEIQFDYIRFSTGSEISKVNFGKAAAKKSKEDIIVEFTKYAYETLKPLGVYVSADVFGTIINSSVDAATIGQNYVEMAKNLDYICPMIYPSHFGEGNFGVKYPDLEPYEIINKVLAASKLKLDQIPEDEHKAIVRPWLQDFTATWIKHHMTYGSKELRQQIEGVYSVDYEEWLLWNAGCSYSEEGLLDE